MAIADFFTSFILGLLTPLTAVCVLPLYPAFLSYLSNKLSGTQDKKLLVLFGIIITLGVVLFMLLLGLIFTTLLSVSLTSVIGIISPIAFGVLFVISILLIFDVDIGKYLPKYRGSTTTSPLWNAFVYGFFFGAIVIPCNPLFIAALFTKTALSSNFIGNIFNFLAFGIGIGFPLLVFSAISSQWSSAIIGWLTMHKRKINLIAGIFMLIVSIYYLIFVFRIFG